MEIIFHLYAYLKQKHNSRLALDPTYPQVDMRSFHKADWTDFYGNVAEAVPNNAPEPRGKDIELCMFVDLDHANDKIRRRSRTGFCIFINMACLMWHTKRQATFESALFGAEFVAMKQGMEASRGLRYKLRMMGILIIGSMYMYGDNMSTIHNTQRPESTLKKKLNSICYHAIREALAMGEILTGHVKMDKSARLFQEVSRGKT